MIANAPSGEAKLPHNALALQEAEFTAEGAPSPGYTSGTKVPSASDGISDLPPTASIFIDEWDMLMMAIQQRLRLTVGAAPRQDHDGVAEPVRACVLECVQALQQLLVLRLHAGPQPGGGERLASARARLGNRAQER